MVSRMKHRDTCHCTVSLVTSKPMQLNNIMNDIIIPVYVTNPFELSVSDYLETYKNTIKYRLSQPMSRVKYAKFLKDMTYYGLHSLAPIKIILNEGNFNMARNYRSIEFVDCQLTKDDEKPLEKFIADYKGNVSELLQDIGSAGYTVKLGFYVEHAAFACFLQAGNDIKENSNMMLSSWSDEPIECLFMCWYKHKVIFKSGTWETSGSKGKWG